MFESSQHWTTGWFSCRLLLSVSLSTKQYQSFLCRHISVVLKDFSYQINDDPHTYSCILDLLSHLDILYRRFSWYNCIQIHWKYLANWAWLFQLVCRIHISSRLYHSEKLFALQPQVLYLDNRDPRTFRGLTLDYRYHWSYPSAAWTQRFLWFTEYQM